jgi:hypothetical protein
MELKPTGLILTAGAAVAAAIDDAIGVPGAIVQLPVTPQRMLHILRQARAPNRLSQRRAQARLRSEGEAANCGTPSSSA